MTKHSAFNVTLYHILRLNAKDMCITGVIQNGKFMPKLNEPLEFSGIPSLESFPGV